MKKLLLIVMVLSLVNVKAQNVHLTLGAGVSNYQGDLQPSFFTFGQSDFAFAVGALYELSPHWFLRGTASFGKIEGSDRKYSLNASRNLSFSSSITDVFLGAQYDIMDSYEHSFVPYAFSGISIFHFNPQTIDATGGVAFLHELGTEGQGFAPGRKVYGLTQVAIPLGVGVKYSVSENLKINLEIGFRKTFTDYLDDVSTYYVDQGQLLQNNGQRAVDLAYRGDEYAPNLAAYPKQGRVRGNPDKKDWFYFATIGVGFRISE